MSSTSPEHFTMQDPDHGWKPNNRPQSTVARNFMSELDDLFKLDGGIDLLDKNVHQKKQAVSSHAQELEALEAKLRETEERLQQAKTSPPRRDDARRRTPACPADEARLDTSASPLAHRQKDNTSPHPTRKMPGALPETPPFDRSPE